MTVAKATRRITKLRVREMSLVGEGDNPHADVLILKHRQIIGVDLDVVKQQLSEVRDGALEIAKALSEGGTPMNIEELTAKLDTIEKSLNAAQESNTTLTGQVADLTGKLETVTKERDDAVAKAAAKVPPKKQADGGCDDPDADDVMKELPEAIRTMIEKERSETKELREQIAKEREEREEGVEIEKVRATGLADPEKFGKLLYRVAKGKSTPEDATTLSEFLAKARALQNGGEKLFKALGVAKGREEGSSVEDAEAAINEKVEAVMKAKPLLSREAAYAEVIDANPSLYDEVQKAKRA
jgi:hypothetical protein